MSSSATSLQPASKLPPASSASNYSQAAPDNSFSKRSLSSGSAGPSALTRQTSQARGNQPLRKQHKQQKKPRLIDEDETHAMRSVNSRKGQTSITHLMNFTLPPRPQHHLQHYNHRHNQTRHRTWGLGSGYHAVDKARYVHANYRFIVRPDREYHAQTVDADIYVSWDAVLQVLASAETQDTSCPICLSTPVAPRMAKCGHIYCLSCLIRYMHSTDESNPVPEKRARWKKCAICEDSIYMSDTRPVRWIYGNDVSLLREGGDILLKLLKREPGSTLALPRDTAESYGRSDDIPWFHVAGMMDYARFMKGGEDYMVAQYDQEIADLDTQGKEDELMFGDDNTWTRKAVLAIEDLKQKLSGLGNPPAAGPTTSACTKQAEVPESWDAADQQQDSILTTALQEMSLSPIAIPAKSAPIPPRPGHGPPRPLAHSFYFYHALPNFFLSPLDIRILKAAFGDFSAFPSTILPRMEHISTGHVIDDDLRKRAKYMAHLPYGFEVSFLECDWTDVISPAILEQFKEEISRRRKRNSEKEAREERDRIRAEKEEEDKRWAAARRPRRPSVGTKSFTDTDFQPLVDPSTHASSSPGLESNPATTPPWGNNRAQSAFATLATPGTSPDAPRTVWGTTAVAPTTPPVMAAPAPTVQVDDGWLQDWEKDLLDEGEAVAMVEASLSGGGRQKKGKKKKITLMSTGNRRTA
ncbi:putative RING finger protein P8B7.23 [Cladophialophora carrionii]|uniref:Putative RING finger protein P8B7.23 n=1 Tax=Cladophialophora carrionii TaxID=86049 RepID=A0A1C1CBG5_9EURO|nr:putative RING finger protein P8B7.23 [Cladophialophora carrionii]